MLHFPPSGVIKRILVVHLLFGAPLKALAGGALGGALARAPVALVVNLGRDLLS